MSRILFILAASVVLAGCSGGSSGDDSAKNGTATQSGNAVATTGTDASGRTVSKGIGPIESIDVSTLDPVLADAGAATFQAKCTACHKIEERYIGPALYGVTKRRQPEWILNMILNPDVMVKEDPVAKGLIAEYIAPMTNQNLTEEEAKSVLTFFMRNDSMELETQEKEQDAE